MPASVGRPVGLDMRQPFTHADAVSAGVSMSALRGANFRRIFHGVYIHASVPDHPLIRVRAALLVHPSGAFASHASAARVYGVPLPALPEEHVTVPDQRDRRRREGIRTHVAAPGTPVIVVAGVPVASAVQMFVELAELLHPGRPGRGRGRTGANESGDA